MHYQEVIGLLKYLFGALAILLAVFRWMRIVGFNSKVEEPVPFRLFSYYNTIEVEGTDIPARRYFMRRMNRLVGLSITCGILTAVAHVLPALLAKFGL